MTITDEISFLLKKHKIKSSVTYYMGYSVNTDKRIRQLSFSVMHWAQGYIVIDMSREFNEDCEKVPTVESQFDRIIHMIHDAFSARIIHSERHNI